MSGETYALICIKPAVAIGKIEKRGHGLKFENGGGTTVLFPLKYEKA